MRTIRWILLIAFGLVAVAPGVATRAQDAVKAYYTPARFDGQELNVVINSSFLNASFSTSVGGENVVEAQRKQFQ